MPGCLNNRDFPRFPWTAADGAAHSGLPVFHAAQLRITRACARGDARCGRMNTPVAYRQTSALAIVSLVAGLLGWSLLPVIGSIVAIVTGHLARAEIRRRPEALEGDGLAVAGLVLGYVMVAMALVGLLFVFLFFGGLLAVIAAAS